VQKVTIFGRLLIFLYQKKIVISSTGITGYFYYEYTLVREGIKNILQQIDEEGLWYLYTFASENMDIILSIIIIIALIILVKRVIVKALKGDYKDQSKEEKKKNE